MHGKGPKTGSRRADSTICAASGLIMSEDASSTGASSNPYAAVHAFAGAEACKLCEINFDRLKFDSRGLIPCIVQDADTGQVLMMAWMSRESLRLTIESGETVFWSRSRHELWHKGETSGNTQKVERILLDCDGDTLLVLVSPKGPACHTGETSCFYRQFVV